MILSSFLRELCDLCALCVKSFFWSEHAPNVQLG
jgi:hypothetical protein